MSDSLRERLEKYLLGATFIAVLIFGGGSASGLAIDSALQVILYASSALVLISRTPTRFSTTALIFATSIAGVVLIQLIPLPSQILNLTQGALPLEASEFAERNWRPISLNPGRTLEQLFWVGSLIAFFLALTQTSERNLLGLLPFALIGISCHLTIALFQYAASSGNAAPAPLLEFDAQAGFFANQNHFSTLIFVSIPLAFAWFGSIQRSAWVWPYIGLCILVLFAVGSRAGMGIVSIVALVSFLLFSNQHQKISKQIILIGGFISASLIILLGTRFIDETVYDQSRWLYATTTFAAIVDNFPVGTGFGTFRYAYAPYEGVENVYQKYVNHAHNDFLEIILEGGVIALILLIYSAFTIGRCMRQSSESIFARLCSVSVCAVLLHSLVDYPLRTMAVSITFGYLIAVLVVYSEKKIRRPA